MPADEPNVVICYQTGRARLRDKVVSENEILVGHNVDTETVDGRVRSIGVKDRLYDLKAIVDELPSDQAPDLVLVRASPEMDSVPINVAKMSCPTVLLAAETHHCYPAPQIRNLLTYATGQGFDLVISESSREHLHFFADAGIANVEFIPFFNANIFELDPPPACEPVISFIGYLDAPYPRRRRMLHAMAEKDLPVFHQAIFGREMAEACARAQVNFNCSLNGDVNYRIGEVLAAGGFLLTDRLTENSGIFELFEDGKDLVFYDGADDLLEKAAHYLGDVAACADIARRGQQTYLSNHRPEKKIAHLFDAVARATGDKIAKPSAPPHDALARAAVFEFLLELHRENETPRALFFPGVAPDIRRDAADLVRLQCDDVTVFDPTKGPWHAAVLTSTDFAAAGAERLLDSGNIAFLVFEDLAGGIGEPAPDPPGDLTGLGATALDNLPFVFDCRTAGRSP